MNSFIITSKNKLQREQKALQICTERKIEAVDIFTLDKDALHKKDKKKPVLSIGIEDIKELQKTLYLKPIKSINKACIIRDAHYLTTEAQNSMLKILEEPPAHTVILLTVDNKGSLLPTLLSRCQIIEIKSIIELPENERNEIQKQIIKLQSLTTIDSLVLAENLSKNKEASIKWMENMITVLREKLLTAAGEEKDTEMDWYKMLIQKFQKSYQTVQTTNINLRMTLEILFLSICSKEFK